MPQPAAGPDKAVAWASARPKPGEEVAPRTPPMPAPGGHPHVKKLNLGETPMDPRPRMWWLAWWEVRAETVEGGHVQRQGHLSLWATSVRTTTGSWCMKPAGGGRLAAAGLAVFLPSLDLTASMLPVDRHAGRLAACLEGRVGSGSTLTGDSAPSEQGWRGPGSRAPGAHPTLSSGV